MAKKWKPKNAKLTPREAAHTQAARQEVHGGGHDVGWGTSPASLGEVKRASEEAQHVTCPECGFSRGRHARMCPRSEG
jgi:hypothetical protein